MHILLLPEVISEPRRLEQTLNILLPFPRVLGRLLVLINPEILLHLCATRDRLRDGVGPDYSLITACLGAVYSLIHCHFYPFTATFNAVEQIHSWPRLRYSNYEAVPAPVSSQPLLHYFRVNKENNAVQKRLLALETSSLPVKYMFPYRIHKKHECIYVEHLL